ncbi:hypothetical protein LGN12_12950 [Burkholderia multivorans]|uniref:hypothetical protein n=1 Tax=Burkholderia multivorans TaxID=87883 RepID=UPI001C23963F|nr:hypothetical protein [Burkholderia multivorans]MBU9608257.1 hypothetical protein [Burkholderia multivorans]MCA8248067.1 hypothetical protein [Burkholderia multivorans]
MSNSTTLLDTISTTQATKEVVANALFDAASPGMIWGRRASTTSGLTWGYYGGYFNGGAIANGTLTLTAGTTNYIYADSTTGAVGVSTTGMPVPSIPLYTVVTGSTTVSSYIDLRAYQPNAIGGGLLSKLGDVSVPASGITAVISPGTNTTYSTSAYAWKGNILTATVASWVAAITTQSLSYTAGIQYQAAIAPVSGSTIGTPVFSAPVTPAASGTGLLTFQFATPVSLTAGQKYAFLIGAVGKGASYALPIAAPNSLSWPSSSYFTMNTIARIASDPLVSGAAYDTNSSSTSPVYLNIELCTPTPAGQYLRSTGSGWTNSAIQASDLPVMGASGVSHAAGAVPDPGATAGTTRFLREDGSWQVPGPVRVDLGSYTPGIPGAGQILLQAITSLATTLPASLAGSFAYCANAPSTDVSCVINQISGSTVTQIGTIAFSAGATTGTFTFAASVTTAPGDVIQVVAPSSADTTFAGISIALLGTRAL